MSTRQQRRLAAKQEKKKHQKLTRVGHFSGGPLAALAGLENVAGQLQEILQAGDEMTELAGQLQEVLDKVQEARNSFESVVEELDGTREEQERQRWVTLRMIACIIPADPSDPNSILAIERQFRAEFDAIRGLQALAESHGPKGET